LTLRKRYSIARGGRGGRQQSRDRDGGVAGGEPSSAAEDPADPTSIIDPWQDYTERPSHGRTLSHRLSYDHASGVIMLPDEAEWLHDEDDSEEDYGVENGLERSVTESMLSEPGVAASDAMGSPGQGTSSIMSSPLRLSRYGTYFHHPERRRQAIPGAFPVPGR